jgi:hypothetical protein
MGSSLGIHSLAWHLALLLFDFLRCFFLFLTPGAPSKVSESRLRRGVGLVN